METLDTLAILKGRDPEERPEAGRARKNHQTNPISPNQRGINGFAGGFRRGWTVAQGTLPDRSTGIRGDADLRAHGSRNSIRDKSEVSDERPDERPGNEMTKRSPFPITIM